MDKKHKGSNSLGRALIKDRFGRNQRRKVNGDSMVGFVYILITVMYLIQLPYNNFHSYIQLRYRMAMIGVV